MLQIVPHRRKLYFVDFLIHVLQSVSATTTGINDNYRQFEYFFYRRFLANLANHSSADLLGAFLKVETVSLVLCQSFFLLIGLHTIKASG